MALPKPLVAPVSSARRPSRRCKPGMRRPRARRLLFPPLVAPAVVRVDLPPKGIPPGKVTFHPFTARREGDAWLLGVEAVGRWVEISIEGKRAIDFLQAGIPWQEVPSRLRSEFGVDYDMPAFLRRLAPLGFIHTLGPMTVWDGRSTTGTGARARGHSTAPEEAGACDGPPSGLGWLRDPRAVFPVLAVTLWGLGSLASNPHHIARPQTVLYASEPLVVLLTFLLAGWLITLGHEAAHYAVARAYGVRARMQLGTRLHLLVCETDVTNAWGLPRWQRAYILAAGIGFNLMVLAGSEIALRAGPPPWLANALGVVLLVDLIQLALQGLVFLRMDGYYLVVALTSERNLQARAVRAMLATWGRGEPCTSCRGPGTRAGDGADCPLCTGGRRAGPRRRRVLATYGLVTIVASTLLLAYGLALMATILVPFMLHLATTAITAWTAGQWWRTAQAALVLGLLVAQLIAVAWIGGRKATLSLKHWRNRRRPSPTQ